MGAVFKGVDLMLEREVAIKMLRPELSRQPAVVERFRTEAVTLAKLNHSNVATLHSFFRQGEDFFMVMEFVRGQTLDEVIRAQGAMHCNRAIELFCMALEGIDHAHKMGIVHRDIKPANMMLTDTGSIKVMDFGIARVLGTDRMTKAGHLIGTVEYMSPEQVRGEETDARSDIYSLGILLYEMLTGRVPFTSTSEYELMRCQIEDAPAPPRTHAPHIPLSVEQAIMRSLAKKREARYQSAGEFRTMLINRNTGAVTRPLDATNARTGPYAAPATQVDRTKRMTPPSGDTVKATRLAGDQSVAHAAAGGEIKATRLAQKDAAVYSQSAPGSGTAVIGAPRTPFLSRLNWKHYAGAGSALLILIVAVIAGTFAMRGGGGSQEAVEPSGTEPPTVEAEVPSAAPAASEPAAVPPPPTVQTTPTQPAPVVSGNPPTTVPGSTSSGASNVRARTAPPKTTETTAVSPEAPPVQPPPQTQPAPKEETVVATKPEPEKKEPEKKPEVKKKGFFGKIKDALTGSNKNKNAKKP
jgi:serine/threonine-protein kinase